MLLEIENWHLGYAQIVQDCQAIDETSGCAGSCLILCAPNVDALAAARIWTYMLRGDSVSYQLLPCFNYSQLNQILETSITADNSIRAVCLVNLGASKNLTRLFQARPVHKKNNNTNDNNGNDDNYDDYGNNQDDEEVALLPPLLPPQVKIFVLDCVRPVHLGNVHAGNNVVVFWDNIINEVHQGSDQLPSDGDNLSGKEEESSSDDEDEDSSSSEEEFDGDEDNDEGEHEFQDEDEGSFPTNKGSMKGNQHQADEAMEEQATDYDGDREDDDNNDHERDEMKDNDDSDDEDRFPKKKSQKAKRRTRPQETGGDMEHDDEDDNENDLSSGGEENPDQTMRTETTAPSSTAATSNVMGEDEDGDNSQQQGMPSLTPREAHRDRRQRLQAYYACGSCYGSPASHVAYRISTQLRFGADRSTSSNNGGGGSGDLLWLACVGVTDAYLHTRLDVAGYTSMAMDLRSHCNRLFPNTMYHRVETSVYAERLLDNDSEQSEVTKIGFSENGRILSEADFRFFLLRHSSLFDAMVYSDYVSTRLQLLTSRGMHKLQELLAKMGYPLDQCHQPFAFMKPSLRRRLREQLHLHAPEYGLEQFEFTSFFRVTGYQSLLSASDTSYAVTALLESDRRPFYSSASSSSNDNDPGMTDEQADLEAFNIAFDALNSNAVPTQSLSLNGLSSTDTSNALSNLVNGSSLFSGSGGAGGGGGGLGAGIRLAMSLQRNILAAAASLVDRNAITRLSYFRYAYITCTSSSSSNNPQEQQHFQEKTSQQQQHHIFAKPLALTRLAHYLIDLHRENGKWVGAKARPLILCAEKPSNSTYLVAGFEYPESAGHRISNHFGRNFEFAAESMVQGSTSIRLDGLDSHVIEVAASEVQRFIEQLHYLMESTAMTTPPVGGDLEFE